MFLIFFFDFYIINIFRYILLYQWESSFQEYFLNFNYNNKHALIFHDVFIFQIYYLIFICFLTFSSISLICFNDYSILSIYILQNIIFNCFIYILYIIFYFCGYWTFKHVLIGEGLILHIRILLMLLEIFSLLCRSLSLFLRFFCNMFSSHVLTHIVLQIIIIIYTFLSINFLIIIFINLTFILLINIDIFAVVLQIIVLLNILYLTLYDFYIIF